MNNYINKKTRKENNLKEIENKDSQILVFNKNKRNLSRLIPSTVFVATGAGILYWVSSVEHLHSDGLDFSVGMLPSVLYFMGIFLGPCIPLLGGVLLFSPNSVDDLFRQVKFSDKTLLYSLYESNMSTIRSVMDNAKDNNRNKHIIYNVNKEEPEKSGYYKVSSRILKKVFKPKLVEVTTEKTLFACDTTRLSDSTKELLKEQGELRNTIELNAQQNSKKELEKVITHTTDLVENLNNITQPSTHEINTVNDLISQMNKKLKQIIVEQNENVLEAPKKQDTTQTPVSSRIDSKILTDISSSLNITENITQAQRKYSIEII